MTEKEMEKLLKPYQHKAWFRKGDKNIKECIEYFASNDEFYLDIIGNKWTMEDNIKYFAYADTIPRHKAIEACVKFKLYDKLRIKHSQDGFDKGILKVKYFIECREKTKLKLY